MASLGHYDPPTCPEEVVLWLKSQELSSTKLRVIGKDNFLRDKEMSSECSNKDVKSD